MFDRLIEEFITLWVAIDPIGTVPVFLAVTAHMSPQRMRVIAVQAVLAATAVLLFFLVAGQFILEALGIPLEAFQIAGGIILFLFAMTMIFGESRPDEESKMSEDDTSVAVYPLAVPSVAGSGAILVVVLLTDNNRFSVQEQAMTAGVLLVVLAITFVLMLAAKPILRVIRKSGAAIISRIMGILLASVAVNAVVDGMTTLVQLKM